MVDYSLNGSFDVYLNGMGKLDSVSGREEFEQDVIVELHYSLLGATGGVNQENLTEKINTIVRRTAVEFEVLDSINRISVTEHPDEPNTVQLFVEYTSDETFEETI